jgi:hypothetical protein
MTDTLRVGDRVRYRNLALPYDRWPEGTIVGHSRYLTAAWQVWWIGDVERRVTNVPPHMLERITP